MKKIKVKIVYDKEFEESMWSFDFRKETKRALKEFEKQFDVRFQIKSIEEWKSVGNSDLALYPGRTLMLLKGNVIEKDFLDFVIENSITSGGITLEKKDLLDYRKALKDCYSKVKTQKELLYFLGFMDSLTERLINLYLKKDIVNKFPLEDREVIIAFTGKVVAGFQNKKASGKAYIEDSCITIFPSISEADYSKIILHEIGHLFGAEHSENLNSVMVCGKNILSYEFDSQNKDLIINSLKNN